MVAGLASAGEERRRRELVVELVYGVLEELPLDVEEGWDFAEWLLARAAADARREPAERLEEAVGFVDYMRWYVAAYAPQPSSAPVVEAARLARMSRPRARSPRRRTSSSSRRGRARPSADDDPEPEPLTARAEAAA